LSGGLDPHFAEHLACAPEDELEGHAVLSALWDDHVGVALRGLDEGLMHRPDGVVILAPHLIESSAAVLEVASNPSDHPNVRVGVDEHPKAHPLAKRAIGQHQDAFDDDDGTRRDAIALGHPHVTLEIVARLVDGPAGHQLVDVVAEERKLERVGVVVVDEKALLEGERRLVAVVAILLDQHHMVRTVAFGQGAGDGGLARAAAARDPDHEGCHGCARAYHGSDEAKPGCSRGADRARGGRYRRAVVEGERPGRELRYDARELRRLVAMSFSLGELVPFAAGFGVVVDGSRSADEAARELVRAIESRGELPALVARLEAEKPLVVWPSPQPVERRPAPSPEPLAAPARPEVSPVSVEPVPGPLVDPFLTGGLDEPRAPSRPIALIAAGVVVGVGLGVLAMWLLFFRGDAPTEPAVASGSPATVAARTLRGAVEAVVEVCGAGSDESSARGALSAAFTRCSRQDKLPPLPNLPIEPAPPPPPSRMTRLPTPAAPAPAAGRQQACLDACHEQQQACRKSRCGSEPTSASEYPQYQQCLGQCTAPAMRCRLSCR
jgi:hypothetical protein